MDNLTHSLVGALIGQMGFKRKTGLAMPTLIIAANIPDIDAVATLLGGQQHLAMRRGITHGPIALVVLPLLLWGIMLWFDHWQAQRGTRPERRLPVHKGWLLALAYIGCLSHPLFDWFNSYGIRFLEPFSSQWFYGDTLFIIDPWLWAALIGGIWFSRRYERMGSLKFYRPAVAAALLIGTYITANNVVSTWAEHATRQAVKRDLNLAPTLVVANPVPIQFWKREMLWRDEAHFGEGSYVAPDRVTLTGRVGVHNASPRLAVKNNKDATAFLFWARMPVVSQRREDANRDIAISDQRFVDPMVGDRFTVRVKPEDLRK
jgi:inner membrane protein